MVEREVCAGVVVYRPSSTSDHTASILDTSAFETTLPSTFDELSKYLARSGERCASVQRANEDRLPSQKGDGMVCTIPYDDDTSSL